MPPWTPTGNPAQPFIETTLLHTIPLRHPKFDLKHPLGRGKAWDGASTPYLSAASTVGIALLTHPLLPVDLPLSHPPGHTFKYVARHKRSFRYMKQGRFNFMLAMLAWLDHRARDEGVL